MSKLTVKADKDLFERWRKLGETISNIAGVVQNDMELERSSLKETQKKYKESTYELYLLYKDTMAHILKCNKKQVTAEDVFPFNKKDK